MTPSFEFFDVASSRRAYFSAADQERAGYIAEITHGSRFRPAEYDIGIELSAESVSGRFIMVGMS
ncbi:MAG: hypothetical protein JWN23_2451 [Rhodocyclales bacterium]|nr:hypothetical protein [Rhodocyclales bacterium]